MNFMHNSSCAVVTSIWLWFWLAGSNISAQDDNVIAEFNIAKRGALAVVDVSMEQMNRRFVIDTGASPLFLDKSLCEKLPLRSVRDLVTAGGVRRFVLFETPAFHFGGIDVPNGLDAASLDFGMLSTGFGSRLDGIIGCDVMKRFVVQFDSDAGKLRFLRTSPMDAGAEFALLFDEMKVPKIELLTAVGAEKFVVDSGNYGELTTTGTLFRKLVKAGVVTNRRERLTTSAAATTLREEGQLRELKLGVFEHKELSIHQSDVNTIGNEYLARFVVTIDFPNKVMFLRPSKLFDMPSRRDKSGLAIGVRNNHVVVVAVNKNGPAFAAGLKEGDILVRIDDKVAVEMPLHELRLYLCNDGATRRLEFRQGEITRKVELTLSDF